MNGRIARGDLDGLVAATSIAAREARRTVVFHKMSGSGNDFVMIDGRTSSPAEWTRDAIARICDRRNGIGGDGLVFVTPAGEGAVRMTYFNSDGSPAPMCGNAALGSTRLAARLEMADPAGMTLVTEAATFSTRCVGPGEMAELHLPDAAVPVPIGPGLEPGEQWIRRASSASARHRAGGRRGLGRRRPARPGAAVRPGGRPWRRQHQLPEPDLTFHWNLR